MTYLRRLRRRYHQARDGGFTLIEVLLASGAVAGAAWAIHALS